MNKIVLVVGGVVGISIIIFMVFTNIIPQLQNEFNKVMDRQIELQEKTWDCIDYCDSYNVKPSHESCYRWCTSP